MRGNSDDFNLKNNYLLLSDQAKKLDARFTVRGFFS